MHEFSSFTKNLKFMFCKALFKFHYPIISLCAALIMLFGSQRSNAQKFYYGNSFIDTTKQSNTEKNVTILDKLRLINDPTLQIQLTVNYSANTSYVPFNCGIVYDSIYWSVINEGGYLDSIPVGLNFNVLLPSAHGSTILEIASSTNISGNSCRIDNVLLNNNPDALLFVTHNYYPSGSNGIYEVPNTDPIGVKYDGEYWNIFNEDNYPFPPNTAYNVFVADTSSNTFIATATVSDTNSYQIYINNPAFNDTNTTLIVTQNFNPGNSTGVYNPNPIGVRYTGSEWAIFNLNSSKMPLGASFNVIASGDSEYVSGINSPEIVNSQVSIFPNPAQAYANITYNLTRESQVTLRLINSTGTVVKEIQGSKMPAGEQHFTDDVSQLPNGFYVYEMITENNVLYKKIIIIH